MRQEEKNQRIKTGMSERKGCESKSENGKELQQTIKRRDKIQEQLV